MNAAKIDTLLHRAQAWQNAGVTETVIEELTTPTLDDGAHDRFAHYVKKSDIVRANVEGVEVIALCGKKWIPNRDPSAYPVCPSCKEIMNAITGKG